MLARGCTPNYHIIVCLTLRIQLVEQGTLQLAAKAACHASMRRNVSVGGVQEERSLVEYWSPDPGHLLETRDGTLVWVFSFSSAVNIVKVNGRNYWAFGGAEAMPNGVMASVKSTDGGNSFGDPINMDDTNRSSNSAAMDETGNWEATSAYTHGGAVFAYAPAHLYDPWSSWSFDAASSWAPVTRAPLLVCAHANSAITTNSGVVLVAGRFPGLSLMVSWDDAMSWEFFLIDTSGFAANGALVEVEPDVVMSVAPWHLPLTFNIPNRICVASVLCIG